MKIVSCDEETLFELIASNKASDVELMLESGVVSVDCEFDGKTPLVQAVELGLGKMVMLLLNAGADPTRRDAQGRCPVQLASDQESLWSFFGARGFDRAKYQRRVSSSTDSGARTSRDSAGALTNRGGKPGGIENRIYTNDQQTTKNVDDILADVDTAPVKKKRPSQAGNVDLGFWS